MHFQWWIPDFVSVELFKVKKNMLKQVEFWKFSKITAKVEVKEN